MIKWGIIGLGKIADQFATSLQEVNNSELVAISSSKQKKLDYFGKKYKIENNHRFINYENLLKCKNVDVIYIATVNKSHFDIILESIKHEKNILCEKPVSINTVEINKIIQKLKEKKLFFSEAMHYRFHPQTKILIDTIKSGEIGKILYADIEFGFAVSKLLQFFSPNNRLFDKVGGGTILDTGCYCTSFALLIAKLCNKTSDSINFKIIDVSITKNRKKVEDFAKAKVVFGNGFEANLKTSFRMKMKNELIIYGTGGNIKISNPWFPDRVSVIEIQNNFKKYQKVINSDHTCRVNTLNIVSNLIEKKQIEAQFPFMSWMDTADNMKIIDEWKRIGSKKLD